MTLAELSENTPMYLAHELVHWHADDYWTTLPKGVEEGLAIMISIGLTSPQRTWTVLQPSDQALNRVLTATAHEWVYDLNGAEGAGEAEYGAAVWVVSQVGLDELRTLATRAQSKGLEKIPPGWIQTHLGIGAMEFNFNSLTIPSDN